jgi:hypothetical protein
MSEKIREEQQKFIQIAYEHQGENGHVGVCPACGADDLWQEIGEARPERLGLSPIWLFCKNCNRMIHFN